MLKALLQNAQRGLYATIGKRLQNLRSTGDDLDRLAILHGSDKRDRPLYTYRYQQHFAPLRRKKLNLLEIGVGGYKDPKAGGNSLRMWKDYFPNSQIHGLDMYDKRAMEEPRIRVHQGNQTDEKCLLEIYRQMGSLDIVIDDGSHFSEHVIFTFNALFPLLSENGIYAIEDTQASYWKFAGGDGENLQNPLTLMNFFKGLADGLNYQEIPRQNYQPTLLEQTVVAIHFYHNLIFVQKGRNEERSNKADFVARLAAEAAHKQRVT
jgi:hypothetical protein